MRHSIRTFVLVPLAFGLVATLEARPGSASVDPGVPAPVPASTHRLHRESVDSGTGARSVALVIAMNAARAALVPPSMLAGSRPSRGVATPGAGLGSATRPPARSGPDDEPTYNAGLRSYNRYSAFTVGDPSFGTDFALTVSARASYRFTNHGSRAVDMIWLYYRTRGSQALTYRVALHPDDCGRPGAAVIFQDFTAHAPDQPAWHGISLPSAFTLGDDEVWHVVIEPVSGVNGGNFILLVSAMNRFPVPFQPYDHTGGGRRVSGTDDDFALLYDGDQGVAPDLVVQRAGNQSYSPLFLLEATNATVAIGNPYDSHADPEVCGLDRYGQRIRPDQDVTVNHVAVFARAAGTAGDGEPSAPLSLRLQRVETNGARTPLETVVLVDPAASTSMTYGRSHYFTAFFGQSHTLVSGLTYELLVLAVAPGQSCDVPNDKWQTSLESSTLVPDHSLLPTFGVQASHAFFTTDGGTSYVDVLDGDLPFILSELPDEPLAQMDEYGTFPLSLDAGEGFSLHATVRNLGRDAAAGEIYARLRYRDTFPVIPPTILAFSPDPLDNDQEASAFDLPGTMPANDLFMWLEVGHLDAQGNEVIDEQIPVEIRLD